MTKLHIDSLPEVFLWLIGVGTSVFALFALSEGLVRRRAYVTRRDPAFPCATTAEYVDQRRYSHRLLQVGGCCFVAGVALAASIDPLSLLPAAGIASIAISYQQVTQYRRFAPVPIRTVELHDDNIHLYDFKKGDTQ